VTISLTNPVNGADPLLGTGPEKQKILFDSMVRACHGHATDVVIGAALNLLINAIRQSAPSKDSAERDYNEIFGKGKGLLFQHYDSVTGKRRSVFPHTQVIEMPHLIADDRKH
jgi:hypothetical protein